MKYSEWERSVPEAIRRDSVWNAKACRLALFLFDVARHDATKLLHDKRTLGLSDQLYRSVCAISADIEEGYSRGSGRDRARFYEYGLGSAREARGWYYKARNILKEQIVCHRIDLLTEIIKLLLAMVPDQRGETLREEPQIYRTESREQSPATGQLASDLITLPDNVPMA